MIRLSRWAKRHAYKARFILVVGHALLILLACYLGQLLIDSNLLLPKIFFYGAVGLFLAAALFYPVAGKADRKKARLLFARRKTADFSLALAAFCMITGLANRPELSQGGLIPLYATSVIHPVKDKVTPTAAEILASLQYRDKSTLTRTEKKVLKKEFKVQLKNFVAAKLLGDKKAADNSGLILLTIIGAIGLFVLLGMLACNISCNGSTGGAVIVSILGSAAIILGMVLIFRGIRRKKMNESKKQPAAA